MVKKSLILFSSFFRTWNLKSQSRNQIGHDHNLQGEYFENQSIFYSGRGDQDWTVHGRPERPMRPCPMGHDLIVMNKCQNVTWSTFIKLSQILTLAELENLGNILFIIFSIKERYEMIFLGIRDLRTDFSWTTWS